MLKIRLQRVGRKHDPSFRIVATQSTTGPKSNKHVAILGQHDSIRKTTTINDPELIKKYMSEGAQVSPRVYNILVSEGVIEGKKVNVLPKKSAPAPETSDENTSTEEATEEKSEEESAE